MPDDVNIFSELEKTVFHEVGHALVAELLGKPISFIKLFHTKPNKIWEGSVPINPFLDIDSQWIIRHLDSYIPFDESQLHPYPADEYKNDRDICTIKFAGLVTEKLMSKDENSMPIGESATDIALANQIIQRFPSEEREKELLNAETRARIILSNPICWSMLENLAKELINAIHQGWGTAPLNGERAHRDFPRPTSWTFGHIGIRRGSGTGSASALRLDPGRWSDLVP